MYINNVHNYTYSIYVGSKFIGMSSILSHTLLVHVT